MNACVCERERELNVHPEICSKESTEHYWTDLKRRPRTRQMLHVTMSNGREMRNMYNSSDLYGYVSVCVCVCILLFEQLTVPCVYY